MLEAFDQDTPVLTASQIARRAGLPVATAHRLVAKLVALGLLERDADRRVRVGVRMWEIPARAPRALGLREAAMPFMEEDLHAATRSGMVVGTGQAAAQLAVSLRQRGYDGPVTLVGEEAHLPYERPAAVGGVPRR